MLGVRSSGYQRGAHLVNQHVLAVEFHLERLALFNNLVDALAEVSGFEMRASLRTLVLLPSLVFGIDSFIIVEVNIFTLVIVLFLLLLEFVLVFFVVWQLVEIVGLLMALFVGEMEVVLLGMHPSLLISLIHCFL